MPPFPQGITHLEFHEDGARFWRISPPGEEDGVGEFWHAGQWLASEVSGAFVDSLKEVVQPPTSPIRIVVDVSGGALHGVYAEVPTKILFISDDQDDINAQLESLEEDEAFLVDENRNAVAGWFLSSDGSEADVVNHYFDQKV